MSFGDPRNAAYKLRFLNQFLIIPIEAKDIVDVYAEIDAFSKGKLLNKPLPAGKSARNMGKNGV